MLHAEAFLLSYLRTGIARPPDRPERWVHPLLSACKAVAENEPSRLIALPTGVTLGGMSGQTAVTINAIEAWLLVGIFGLNESVLVEPGVLNDLDDDA